MDKIQFYRILDIEAPDEFKYYENLAALLEEDDYIELNLIKDLLKDVNFEILADTFDSYFEEFLKNIPDDETDLYLTVDSFRQSIMGLISENMDSEETDKLANQVSDFRKWYIHDLNVYDTINRTELNVRDARYEILAAKLLGEAFKFDFRTACDVDIEGYDIRISDVIDSEF